jgi:hypothetical protein
MKNRNIDVDELDRRWKAFLAQESVATNDDVMRWLQTWGTPSFQPWQTAMALRSGLSRHPEPGPAAA